MGWWVGLVASGKIKCGAKAFACVLACTSFNFLKRWLFLHFVGMFNVYTVFGRVADNGPRIGDSGGLESLNFQISTKLSNSLLLFSKFIKKGNIKGCCDKKRRNFQFLP